MNDRMRQETAIAAAEAVAPLIAEHYYATGDDLSEEAADDAHLMDLALLYAELPAVMDDAGQQCAAVEPGDVATAVHNKGVHDEANQLLKDTADAIRRRLTQLAGKPERQSDS
ncbi:MAG: hypothetical protein HOV67_04595 [Kribbellaceae bacterium]|nr:hypothetical protein [Kribbellaceae bacterium]